MTDAEPRVTLYPKPPIAAWNLEANPSGPSSGTKFSVLAIAAASAPLNSTLTSASRGAELEG